MRLFGKVLVLGALLLLLVAGSAGAQDVPVVTVGGNDEPVAAVIPQRKRAAGETRDRAADGGVRTLVLPVLARPARRERERQPEHGDAP